MSPLLNPNRSNTVFAAMLMFVVGDKLSLSAPRQEQKKVVIPVSENVKSNPLSDGGNAFFRHMVSKCDTLVS